MNDLLAALLLGIIEGVTEFLPISSTGHLLIAEHWLGHRSDLFNIAIQAGAILAVVLIYRERLVQLAVGWAQRRHRDYALKLALAFGVTAVCGIVVKKLGFELPEEIAPIAWALLIGGFAILAIEAIDARRPDLPDDDPNAIGWGTAVLVGLAQVLAGVFPGTSRSAAAIFAALLFGKSSRLAATEFAFLVGIPTMFAATGYEVLELSREGGIAGEDWTALSVAFVASAITAFVSVKWLLGYIQTHRFTWFAWYRIVFGVLLLAWLSSTASTLAPTAAESRSADDGGRRSAAPDSAGASRIAASAAASLPAAGPAAASEAVLASREYEALKLCIDAEGERGWFEDPRSRDALDALSRGSPRDVARAAGILDRHERATKSCIGMAGRLRDGSIYDLAARAASLGDRDAATCLLLMRWDLSEAQARDPAFRARFELMAPGLIEAGIAAGDWRMVRIARVAGGEYSLPRSHPLPPDARLTPGIWWLRQLQLHDDPESTAAILRLLALGADEEWQRRYAEVAQPFLQRLTPAQRARVDAWARTTFQSSFRGRPAPDQSAGCV